MILQLQPVPPARPRYANKKSEYHRRLHIGHDVARVFAHVFPPVLSLTETAELLAISTERVRQIQDEAFYNVAMRFRELRAKGEL